MGKTFQYYFLPVWLTGFLVMGSLVLYYGYDNSFLIINKMRIPYCDGLMETFTWIGNGGVASFVAWLFLRKKSASVLVIAIASFLLSGLLSQLGKQIWFSDWHRPLFYFEGKETIYFLPEQAFRFNSFPSGHATTAGTMGFILAYFAGQKRVLSVAFALLSIAIGYSRVYIGVHFPGDVVAGWALGAGVVLLLVYTVYPKLNEALMRKPKLSTGIHLFIRFGVLGVLLYEVYRYWIF
jgi:membrane-associated phospholipid phosphatase